MRVLRGREEDPPADRAITTAMAAQTAETETPALRVWRPPKQVAFGRRDTRAAGYQAAREAAIDHGFPPTERETGGRAVAYPGTAVSIAQTHPVDDIRTGIGERYEATLSTLQRAFWRLSVPAQRGEPADSFCPGSHALHYRGKLAGVAQHVAKGVALVGAIVLVSDHDSVAKVLDPVYDALDVPFDPTTVGSIERADGRADPERVRDTLEEAFIGDQTPSIETI